MFERIDPGAAVDCIDYPLGAVERIEGKDVSDALLVRPARADYLLRVPRSLIAEFTHGRVKLKTRFRDVEEQALAAGFGERTDRVVTLRPADPHPTADEVLGRLPGEPETSPPTG